MKIAVGIPFRASKYDAALRLCLRSLERYSTVRFDTFLLIDGSSPLERKEFDLERIRRIRPDMEIREYKAPLRGGHKQAVIDWICGHGNGYDRAFILHSDVFLYRPGLMEMMLRRLDESDGVSCHWSVPLMTAASRNRVLYAERRKALVAPRISTWLFCLDCRRLSALKKRYPLLVGYFAGHQIYRLDDRKNPLVGWIRAQPEFDAIADGHHLVMCDIGTFFRYVVDMTGQKVFVMGKAGHPELATAEYIRQPEGFVHFEQFSSHRFHSNETEVELFLRRERMILDILHSEYGDE